MSKPYTMTVANGRCTSDPMPEDTEAGNNPNMATVAVMSTGLKRCDTPSTTASFKAVPLFRKMLICDIIITPFWIDTPNSAIKPTAEDTLNDIPLRFRANIPPNTDMGSKAMSSPA